MMSDDTELEDLLTLYALGLLEDRERARLSDVLSQIPEGGRDLAAELQEIRNAAALIGYESEPLDPSPALKQTLWERIRRDTQPPSLLHATRFQDLIWQPHPVTGVEIAILRMEEARREITALFRASGPVSYPIHDHKGPEDIYMIRGDLQVGPIALGPGDFIRSQVGSLHPHTTQMGCLCWVRSCLEDTFLDSNTPLSPEAHYPFILNRPGDRLWQPYATEGVEISIFCQDRDRKQLFGIFRARPQTHYPLHQHGDLEELLMLSGDLIVDEQVFGPGDYLCSPAGSAHDPWTQLGCTFLFRTSMQDLLLSTIQR